MVKTDKIKRLEVLTSYTQDSLKDLVQAVDSLKTSLRCINVISSNDKVLMEQRIENINTLFKIYLSNYNIYKSAYAGMRVKWSKKE